MSKSEPQGIDNVTTTNLDLALRMCGIKLLESQIDLIIDIVEVIERKGNDTSIKDIIEIKSNSEYLKKRNNVC